jgi:hypothetical protein
MPTDPSTAASQDAADDFMRGAGRATGGARKGRGGYYRRADGAPYVSDPSGALVQSGERAGQPRWVLYGSPSGRGKQIENTTNLEKWQQRQLVLGMGLAPELLDLCREVAEADSEEQARRLSDKVIAQAKEVAKANLAADRGTHAHLITEDDDEGRDWLERAEAGELLGLSTEAQALLVASWRQMLADSGLEILASEVACVDDSWRLAGTLDNIARTSRALRFRLTTGELVTIPAGTVLVLDKKSGRRRVDGRGATLHWHGYAIQIASYAQSLPYDTDTQTRGQWPWPISQEHALIAHLDVVGAMQGTPSCELIYVDLVAGRQHGGQCAEAARLWEQRTDLFSVAQVEPLEELPALPVFTERAIHLRERCQSLAGHSPLGADWLQANWPAGCPALPACTTNQQLDAVEAVLVQAEARSSAPFIPGDPQVTPGGAAGAVAEGMDVNPADVTALSVHLEQLPPAIFDTFRGYVEESAEAGCSVSLRERPSVRRYEVARALLHLARAGFVEAFLVEALAHLGRTETPIGAALARLDVAGAQALSDIAAAYADNCLVITYDLDGSATWTINGQPVPLAA